MGEKEIYCEEEVMDLIAEKFGLCKAEVSKIVTAVEAMQETVQEGYVGIAENYNDTCFELLLKHLRILVQCYAQLSNAVKVTKELYLGVDQNSARSAAGKGNSYGSR